MSRVKRGVTAHRRHKKLLARTKGHHGQRHRVSGERVRVLFMQDGTLMQIGVPVKETFVDFGLQE